MQQRLGNRYWTDQVESEGAWVRIEGAHQKAGTILSTTGSSFKTSRQKIKTGIDFLSHEYEHGDLFLGFNAEHNSAQTYITSPSGAGSIDTLGYGVGLTATWFHNNGAYLDAQLGFNQNSSDLFSYQLGSLVKDSKTACLLRGGLIG